MNAKMGGFSSTVWLVVLSASLFAQTPAPAPGGAQTPQGGTQARPTFRVRVDLVRTDVVPRDEKGNFVSTLTKNDFEVYEDGVKQDLTSMVMSYGGRVTNVLAPPPAMAAEGLILPPVRQVNDVSGRVFIFFVDDLHLNFHSTGRVRDIFKKISKTLLHDGDMFGIVSTGTSSISVQLTYDKKRLDEAIEKMTGGGMRPEDIINAPASEEGPTEVRWRAHVAFSTAIELLQNLEKMRDRRKALVYVSDGYDFNPFQDSRLGFMDPSSPFLQNNMLRDVHSVDQSNGVTLPGPHDASSLAQKQGAVFAEADLARELGEITRQANRSNVTMYTIDPRGLTTANSDIDQPVDPQQWAQYLRNSQDSLRVLAEETGGIAVVNMNDFDGALKRIDADSSDYYILGYYSKNPDASQRRRKIEVKVNRPGRNISVASRKEYVLQPEMVDTPQEALPVVPTAPRQ